MGQSYLYNISWRSSTEMFVGFHIQVREFANYAVVGHSSGRKLCLIVGIFTQSPCSATTIILLRGSRLKQGLEQIQPPRPQCLRIAIAGNTKSTIVIHYIPDSKEIKPIEPRVRDVVDFWDFIRIRSTVSRTIHCSL